MRTCPADHVPMNPVTLGSVQIDECPQCKGAWFQDQELRHAAMETDRDLAWMDFEIWKHPDRFKLGPRHLICPDCHRELVEIQYDGTPVTIDYCVVCHGVWLDKGEFARTIQALEDEVTTKSASEYVKVSLAEAKRLFTGSDSLLSEWQDLRAVLRLLRFRFFVEHQRLTTLISRIPRIG